MFGRATITLGIGAHSSCFDDDIFSPTTETLLTSAIIPGHYSVVFCSCIAIEDLEVTLLRPGHYK